LICSELKKIEDINTLSNYERLSIDKRFILLSDPFTQHNSFTNTDSSRGAPILTYTKKIKRQEAYKYFKPVAQQIIAAYNLAERSPGSTKSTLSSESSNRNKDNIDNNKLYSN
jgi:hypothetical protein